MYWLMPGHYVVEGLLVSQFYQDATPIQASAGSNFWNYLGCDQQIENGATECTGSAEDWVYATFEGVWVIENIPANIGYLVGMVLLTRILTVFGLGYCNYRRT
jgi:hypothetical protein